MLQIENIRVALGGKPVLKQVSLEVQTGELLAILGPSGCGKTSLLKVLAGLIEPDAGSATLFGTDLLSLPIERRGVGMLFQDLRLFPHRNVARNIAFSMEMQRLPKEQIDVRVSELLELIQLEGYGQRSVGALSGGQRQRVALARILAGNPRLLLLDEPFSALDEDLRAQMGAWIRTLQQKEKLTTILVTHSSSEAEQLADRVLRMDEVEAK